MPGTDANTVGLLQQKKKQRDAFVRGCPAIRPQNGPSGQDYDTPILSTEPSGGRNRPVWVVGLYPAAGMIRTSTQTGRFRPPEGSLLRMGMSEPCPTDHFGGVQYRV
eukprot:gene25271-biopygen22479